MIIVFGKETRAKLLECAVYIRRCGDYSDKDAVPKSVVRDCRKLAEWLFNIAVWPKKRKGE